MKKILTAFTVFAMSIIFCVSPRKGHDEDVEDNGVFVSAYAKEIVPEKQTKEQTKKQEHNILEDKNLKVGKIMYTNAYVNMRKKPSKDAKILTKLEPNVDVETIRKEGDWYYVCLDNDTNGYINAKLLSDKKTPVSELNRWGIDLNKDEIELLAKILFRETGGGEYGEPYKGQVAVVEVIFNRMIDGYWGKSLYEVLSSKGQFSSWKSRNGATPQQDNYEVIQDVLYGKTTVLSKDYLYFSRGGHSSHNGAIRIGNHQFCKGKKG